MSIQSNINQGISIAGYLFSQTVGKDLAEEREAKRALSSSKATYNAELEKARQELNIPTDRKLEDKEIEDLRSHPRVTKALEIHEANVARYAPVLGGQKQIDEYFAAIEKRAGNPFDDKPKEKGETVTTNEHQMAEEFWNEFDEKHDYYPTESEPAPSTAEVMADKASSAMEEEQARVRGQVKIDHRKKKREQNRRRNERRKERKKLGGMNNGEQ